MATWHDRVKDLIGPGGYENCMRRSLQTVILYEAKRCVAPRLSSLRPFQRKLAFFDQALGLVDSLDFVFPHQKDEILWRTATSREVMSPEVGWKRVKLVEKELQRLTEQIKPFLAPGRTHEIAVNMLVKDLHEKSTGDTLKGPPTNWEHAHNHVIFAFRIYYRGDTLDPNFPPPMPPREIVVPAEKPPQGTVPATAASSVFIQMSAAGGGAAAAAAPTAIPSAAAAAKVAGNGAALPKQQQQETSPGEDEPNLDVAAILGEKNPVEERRRLLQEVRDHLDLLKEFEGAISKEDLAKRKRELFLALPPAPPPCSPNKKAKV